MDLWIMETVETIQKHHHPPLKKKKYLNSNSVK